MHDRIPWLMKYWKITSVISAAICFLITHQAWAAREWVYLESNSSRESYYDKNSIVKVDENVFRLWMKQVLSENGKIKTISKFRNTNKTDNSLDLISYILRQMDVDCRNNQYKDSALIFYDEKSNVLYSSPKGAIGKWDDIVEGSFAYQLKNVICKGPNLAEKPSAILSADPAEKPAEAGTPPQSLPAGTSDEDIRQVVSKWLAAWQSGDIAIYRSCYDEDFKSKNMTLEKWIAYKTGVRQKSTGIKIGIDDLKITADGDHAEAVFIQTYSSSLLNDKGKKTLKLKKSGNEWKIYQEIM